MIEGIVDPLRLEQIKANDPDPDIRVYSIGHEGEASLHLPGIGKKTFTWIQAAVQWINDKLSIGTPVFNKHNPNSNSHAGREQVGEVVGKAMRYIGDRLNTLAAIYIKPQFRSRPLDVASIEAEIEYEQDGSQAWPTAIKNVSGVALGTSGIDNPGFPGATLLGAVQAYVQAFGGDIGDNKMNLSEVKQAVKDLGLSPSQVFPVDDIMGDTAVAGKVKEAKSTLQNAADRWKAEVDGGREKYTKLENEKAGSDKKLQQIQMQSKSNTLIDPLLTDRKLDDKAKVFVKRNLKNFTATATDEDGLKIELGRFVDDANKEYQELAKDVCGVDIGKPDNTEEYKLPPEFTVDGNKPPQSPQSPETPTTREGVARAEMNPDTNPLIPGGKAAKEALGI